MARYLVSVFAIGALAMIGLALVPAPALGADTFDDVPASNTFAQDIDWLAAVAVTKGCNPPSNTRYCPDGVVTRGQMAAFLSRALNLPASNAVDFIDDDGSVFEADIQKLAAAGITRGCNPPANTRYCPDSVVTRGQMAAFLSRALNLAASSKVDFTDDNDSVFEPDIQKLAAAGITKGCNPPSNTRYCPDSKVTRGQMAAFLHRALQDRLFVENYLIDLDAVAGTPDAEGPAEVSGRLYPDSFQEGGLYYGNPKDITYLLSGRYDRFTALAGVRDNSANNDVSYVIQLLDQDAARLWSGTVKIGSPLPIDIDVSGVLRLTVRVTRLDGGIDDYAVLADAKVGGPSLKPPKGSPLPAPPSSGRYLIDLDPVWGAPDAKGPAEVSGRLYPDSFQEGGLYYGNPEDTTYLLSGLYDKFTALAGVRDDSAHNDVSYIIELYDTVAGTRLWSGTVKIGSPLPVDIDVSGVLRLLIRVTRQDGGVDDYAVLADARVGGPGLTPP